LHTYNLEIRQQYSNIDDISLRWLNVAAFGFVGIWVIRLGSNFAMAFSQKGLANLIGMISNYPSLLLIGWMVVLGLSHATRPGKRLPEAGHGAGNGRRAADPLQVEKLEELMSRVRVYQDPELDLDGLADSMGLSPRSLSALINGHHRQNFYDFVNGYRIEAAKELLSDPLQQGKSIQRVFEEAGFNSKSTFNTLFKRATGLTPSAYRRQAIKTGPADHRAPAVR
jgi:AraC-like DNA-binding protein